MSASQLKAVATGKVAASDKPKDLAHLMASASVQAQIKAALPRHMTAERMARIATTELRKTPKLMECAPMSFLGAVIQCAQLGLEPGNALGHAYILPFEKRGKVDGRWQSVGVEAQLIIGYRGMIDLARRSGQILSLSAQAVYEGDEFECVFGLDPTLRHVPNFNDPDRAQAERLNYVYAVAKLKDGGTQFSVMARAEINAIRGRSQGYQQAVKKMDEGKKGDNPWITDYEAMALKTVIRRLFKYLPVSVEMQTAVVLDEKADSNQSQDNNYIIEGETNFVSDEQEEIEPLIESTASGAPSTTYADVLAAMLKAKTFEGLDEVAGLIPAVEPADKRKELSQKYDALRADLQS